MNMTDMPTMLDNPVESLLAFHRRIERHLAMLARLPGHIEVSGAGVEATAMAGAVLHCFGPALAAHHDEEEHDLLPLIERRLPNAQLADYRELRRRIEADHRETVRAWRDLRRPLEAVGEGMVRKLSVRDIQYFRAIVSMHISIEEGSLHSLVSRHLRVDDLETLARRLQQRRGVMKASSR